MNQNENRNHYTRMEIYVVGLISTLISILIGFSMNHYLPVNIQLATVDITSIIHQFVKVESKKSIPLEQQQEQIRAFSSQLESTLKTVSEEKHVVLTPKEAVIAGGVDLTPEVMKRLEESHALKD